jgi:AraC family transcriptional regulator
MHSDTRSLEKPTQARAVTGPFVLGVAVDVTRPGLVEFGATADHRIKVHASGPARGECQAAPFVYGRGDLDILPAGSADRYVQYDESTSVMLQLPHALLSRAAEELGLDGARVGLESRNHLRDPRIEHIAWALEAERAEGHPSGLLYAESLGTALAVHLLSRYKLPQADVARGLSKPQLKRVTEYIEAHLDRDLSLERLAGVAELGMTHFKLLFRRSTGLRRAQARGARAQLARARRAPHQPGRARGRLCPPEPHGALHAPRARSHALCVVAQELMPEVWWGRLRL